MCDGDIESRRSVCSSPSPENESGVTLTICIHEASWEGRARLCSKMVFPLIVRSGQISHKGERTKFLLRASGCGIVRLGCSTFLLPKEMMSTSTVLGLQRSPRCLPIFLSIACRDDKSSTGFRSVSINAAQFKKTLRQELGAFSGSNGADRKIEEVFRILVDVMEFISEALSFKMWRLSPRLEPRLSVAFS